MNSLPRPALAARLHRSAVHLDQPLDERQPDPKPALRPVERAIRLGEQVEHGGEQVGGDADPVSRTRIDRRRRRRGSAARSDAPARVGVLGRVVQQVGRPPASAAPGRRSVEHRARQAGTSSWWRNWSISGRTASTACASDRLQFDRLLTSSRIFPCVMRRHVEQVVHQPDQVASAGGRSRRCAHRTRVGSSAFWRSTSLALRIGASGLRSSWASIDRNSFFCRSACWTSW